MGKIIYNPIILIIFTLVSLVFLLSLRKSAAKTQISNQVIQSLETEVSDLAIEINNTQKQLDKAEEPLSKEKIIRNELLMQKEGETVVQLPDVVLEEDQGNVEDVKPIEKWMLLVLDKLIP